MNWTQCILMKAARYEPSSLHCRAIEVGHCIYMHSCKNGERAPAQAMKRLFYVCLLFFLFYQFGGPFDKNCKERKGAKWLDFDLLHICEDWNKCLRFHWPHAPIQITLKSNHIQFKRERKMNKRKKMNEQGWNDVLKRAHPWTSDSTEDRLRDTHVIKCKFVIVMMIWCKCCLSVCCLSCTFVSCCTFDTSNEHDMTNCRRHFRFAKHRFVQLNSTQLNWKSFITQFMITRNGC